MKHKLLLLLPLVLSFLLVPLVSAQCGSCLVGQTQCSGNFKLSCVEVYDGCTDWDFQATESNFCAAGCIEVGSGIAQCADEGSSCTNKCDPGTSRCEENSVIRCRSQSNGCYDWDRNPTSQIDCQASGSVCVESGASAFCEQAFTPSCTDECLVGQSVCGGTAEQYNLFCGQYDSDACFEYPPEGFLPVDAEYCVFGCAQVGSGISQCQAAPDSILCPSANRCNVEGLTECDFFSSDIRTCEKKANGCLEWAETGITHCPAGCEEIGSGIAICSEPYEGNFTSHFTVIQNYGPGSAIPFDDPQSVRMSNESSAIYVAGTGTDEPIIYKYNTRTGRRINQFNLSGDIKSISSYTWDGDFWWVVDGSDIQAKKFYENWTFEGTNATGVNVALGTKVSFHGSRFYQSVSNTTMEYDQFWNSQVNYTSLINQQGINVKDLAWDGLNNWYALSKMVGSSHTYRLANLTRNFTLVGFLFDFNKTFGHQFTNVESIAVNPADRFNIMFLTEPYITTVDAEFDGHVYNLSLNQRFDPVDQCVLGTNRCFGVYPYGKFTTCVVDPTGTHTIWGTDPSNITECLPVTERCNFEPLTQSATCETIKPGLCPFSSEPGFPGECPAVGVTECTDSTFFRTCVQADYNSDCLVWSTNFTSCGVGKCENGVCFDCADECNLGDQKCVELTKEQFAAQGGQILTESLGVQITIRDPSNDPFIDFQETGSFLVNCTTSVSNLFSSVCTRWADPTSLKDQLNNDVIQCSQGCDTDFNTLTNTTFASCFIPSSDYVNLRNYLEVQSENANIIAGTDSNKALFFFMLMGLAAVIGTILTKEWMGGLVPATVIFFVGILTGWIPVIFFAGIVIMVGLVIAKLIFGFGE